MDDRLSYRRDAGIAAIVLSAILLVVFSPFLFGNESLLSSSSDVPSIYLDGALPSGGNGHLRALDPGAPGWQVEPAFGLSHRIMFSEHRLPFWDPYGGYGKPFMGAMVPQQFYPLSTLVAIHPSPRAYAWWVVARLFVAGFFAALFVRLFFAGPCAAASAGVAAMFTGYYLLYYDMPHLSVEVEMPMALFAIELLMRRVSMRRIALLGSAIGLVILGGMPESAFLLMAAATLYAAVRLLTIPGARLSRIGALAAAYVLGIAIGAIELFPFVELLAHGFSTHSAALQKGLSYDGNWRQGFFTELFPRAFGNPWTSSLMSGVGWTGIRGFFGTCGLYLALVAVASAAIKRDRRTPVIAFLAAIALYSICKRFGNPGINWTGGLPLFVQIEFPKYIEAILGPAMALLAGLGVGYITDAARDRRAQGIAFACTVGLVTYLTLPFREYILPGEPMRLFTDALTIGLAALLVVAICGAIVASTADVARRRACAAILIATLACEPLVGYAIPLIFKSAPPVTRNPYAGAPYLSYLSGHMDTAQERVFGISGMLFPNWASAYGLPDVRSIEAVALRDYIPFVDAFITDSPATSDDQWDRFVATRAIDMGSPLVRRWLALSSVRYIVDPYVDNMMGNTDTTELGDLVAQSEQQLPVADRAAVHQAYAQIDGVTEDVFFEHPPHDVILHARVPRKKPTLTADIALDPRTLTPPVCGGPVTFTLRAYDGRRAVASATRTIDPKHDLTQRHWIPFALDLSASAGRAIDLHFVTSAVDTCSAWALWGEPRFVASGTRGLVHRTLLYPLVYQTPGAHVFEVRGSVPRFSLFHDAVPATTVADAVAALKAPGFDVHRTVVIGDAVPSVGPPHGSESVTVTDVRSDRVDLIATAASDAILMQTDSWYPGWKATVDGAVVPIVHADAIFRGISLHAGRHEITIVYDSSTARIGTILTVIGFLVFLVLVADPAWMRRRIAR
jgi:hypothetical protein